ncbi:T-complex protein 1 subunit epsilon [Pancytospora epiphaga]|nr:T-complex protein 1 subunit epsilon [Pancytospora epiphaga]
MNPLLTDEFGQAFQIENGGAPSLRGKECLYANISTVESIAEFLRTSLGPTGMDKILTSPDGNITVTNDGATILQEMDMSTNPISQLVVQLSQSQDDEIGDGTTSIVVLAAAILRQAKGLIEKGVHPIKIAEGFAIAQNEAEGHLRRISEPISNMKAYMTKAAKTTLNSKIVASADLASLCVEAVLAVADEERKDVDLDLISIQSKTGSNISETKLIRGIVIDKPFSHPQMSKEVKNAKIALLSCPFEPPRLKTKNSLLITSADEYKALEKYEKDKFKEMIESLKNAGADVVMCQWGFDDEANSMLRGANIPAVRWVGGHELGLMAAHISGQIISRFEDLTPGALGIADVREESLTTESEKIIVVENSGQKKSVTIMVRGSTEYVIDEAKRSIRDALCAIRNVFVGDSIVYGGGSAEVSISNFLYRKAKEQQGAVVESAMHAFATALLEIPMALSQNSGYEPHSYVEKLRDLQVSSNDSSLGVDCMEIGEMSMKKADIFEALNSKINQIKMATELANIILKINDVVRMVE